MTDAPKKRPGRPTLPPHERKGRSLVVRLPEPLRARLDARAIADRTTSASLVRDALEQWLAG